jgi:hypothetical protein
MEVPLTGLLPASCKGMRRPYDFRMSMQLRGMHHGVAVHPQYTGEGAMGCTV